VDELSARVGVTFCDFPAWCRSDLKGWSDWSAFSKKCLQTFETLQLLAAPFANFLLKRKLKLGVPVARSHALNAEE